MLSKVYAVYYKATSSDSKPESDSYLAMVVQVIAI